MVEQRRERLVPVLVEVARVVALAPLAADARRDALVSALVLHREADEGERVAPPPRGVPKLGERHGVRAPERARHARGEVRSDPTHLRQERLLVERAVRERGLDALAHRRH